MKELRFALPRISWSVFGRADGFNQGQYDLAKSNTQLGISITLNFRFCPISEIDSPAIQAQGSSALRSTAESVAETVTWTEIDPKRTSH